MQKDIKTVSDTQEKGTINYLYFFNYYGNKIYDNSKVAGVSISVAIRVYKNGNELIFTNEVISKSGIPLSNVICASISQEKTIEVSINFEIEQIFLREFNWDKIEFDIIKGYIELYEGNTDYISGKTVSAEELKKFILINFKNADITDDEKAQCLAYDLIDMRKVEYIWLVSKAEVTDIPPDIYNKIMNGIEFCDEDLKLIHELYVNRNKFITK